MPIQFLRTDFDQELLFSSISMRLPNSQEFRQRIHLNRLLKHKVGILQRQTPVFSHRPERMHTINYLVLLLTNRAHRVDWVPLYVTIFHCPSRHALVLKGINLTPIALTTFTGRISTYTHPTGEPRRSIPTKVFCRRARKMGKTDSTDFLMILELISL